MLSDVNTNVSLDLFWMGRIAWNTAVFLGSGRESVIVGNFQVEKEMRSSPMRGKDRAGIKNN